MPKNEDERSAATGAHQVNQVPMTAYHNAADNPYPSTPASAEYEGWARLHLQKFKLLRNNEADCCCPVHDDNNPSMRLNLATGWAVCLAGSCRWSGSLQNLAKEAELPSPGRHDRDIGRNLTREAEYVYTEASGEPLLKVIRRRTPGGRKTFTQWRREGQTWKPGGLQATPLLFADRLSQAPPGATVFLVEGEKAASWMASGGMLATTAPEGAGKFNKVKAAHLELLRDRRVVILPDNDDAGRHHAVQAAKLLLPIAGEVRVLELPGLPYAGDIVDWGLDWAALLALAHEAPLANDWLTTGPPDQEPWPELIPLDGGQALPTFPLDVFPNWLARYTHELSVSMQVPNCLPGMMGLACLATAAMRHWRVRVKPGHEEPLNLYAACALDPANRKSPVLSAMSLPIRESERRQCQSVRQQAKETSLQRSILKAQLDRAIKTAENSRSDFKPEELQAIQRQLEALEPPAEPRLLADDCTPEALHQLLYRHGERISVLSSEATLFDVLPCVSQSSETRKPLNLLS